MSDDRGVIHSATDGGLAATHATPDPFQFLVAPSASNELNTVRMRLIPVACWRVDDLRFRFDSSFVLPGIQDEMKSLAELLKVHQECPISIFGHADPVGSDDYNKTLSGRRAIATYAMLARAPALWDKLFTQSFGGDKWGTPAVQTMLGFVNSQTSNASAQGSTSSSTPPNDHVRSVANNSGRRQQLYLDYMNALCGSLRLDKTKDFLARNQDSGQKGDVQGCGEFNPTLLFSQEQQDRFDQAQQQNDQSTLQQRNDLNAGNRRVIVLIFRKGSLIDPSKWPCPRFNESAADCQKRFFSDGAKRRSSRLPNNKRYFRDTHDTFACRFYQRLSDSSPCDHTSQRSILWITKFPATTDKGSAILVVKDQNGKELGRLSGSDGLSGPGEYTTFDISEWDRGKPLHVNLIVGDFTFSGTIQVFVGGVLESLAAQNARATSSNFLRVGPTVAPPPDPPLPTVDTTGAEYSELKISALPFES